MTNPFQHGPSGSLPTGLPGFGTRRSSYASVASGTPALSRPGWANNLLNPAPDTPLGHIHSSSSLRAGAGEANSNGAEHNGSDSLYASHRPAQLAPYSRAYQFIMRDGSIAPGAPSPNEEFFVPEYLKDSTYVQKLEDQYRITRQSGQRDPLGGSGPPAGGGGASSNGHNGAHSAKISSGAHRSSGSYDSADKSSVGAGDDEDLEITPLPSRWNKNDKHASLEVQPDGLDVKYAHNRHQSERSTELEACSIRSDQPMPPQCGLYYFEVTIIARKRDDTTIGIGFSDKTAHLSRPPGWENSSYGYHGDDGNCFNAHNCGKPYGPTFTAGDVIGCGLNFKTGSAFFTKNGNNLGVAFRNIDTTQRLFPTVGLKKAGEHVRVNFGQTPFVFDIVSMMKKEKTAIMKEIAETSTKNLEPPLGETELIQKLVLQFLQHDGYVETARAFAEEIKVEKQALSLDSSNAVPGIDLVDDEDANNRQRIRRAVLEGDIDKALKLTNAFYPKVLSENEPVYFRVRCRKYIEMVRRDAEVKISGRSRVANGDMDIDDGMDLEDDDEEEDHEVQSQDLIHQAIAYGQGLQAEYKNDPRPEIHNALNEIFSLMAYQNPLKEPKVAHLLDRKGRVAVAEELNSAILQSLGKSSRSALENLWCQTEVLLSDLSQDGGPGSFVSLQSIVDQLPSQQS